MELSFSNVLATTSLQRKPSFNRPTLDGIDFWKITDDDNVSLLVPFIQDEIKEEVWNCNGSKISGLGGYNIN